MSASQFLPAAYLLVLHGSRDPRPAQAAEQLAQLVRSQLELPSLGPSVRKSASDCQLLNTVSSFERLPPTATRYPSREPTGSYLWPHASHLPLVGTACLESGDRPLHQQIIDFSHRACAAGVSLIRIVPLFLLQGIHVLEDIPAQVHQAQTLLPQVSLQVCPHLGSHPGLKALVQAKLQSVCADNWLLLAHGSRRGEGNAPIQALAQSLGGTIAYWAVAPSLETQVIQLIQKGVQRLAVLPYFLFTGKTTDAITQRTEGLAERFSQISVHLLPPLGPSPELAQLVVDLALNRIVPQSSQSALPMKRVAFRHSIRTSSMVS